MDVRSNNPDRFPLWAYLNQPLFDSRRAFIWRPKFFVRFHKIQQLERCWILSDVQLLEHRWRRDLEDQ